MKCDFPALLTPGLHRLTLEDIHSLAVDPFPEDVRRARLYSRLAVWASELRSCGVSGTLWLDGSFLTAKPEPEDIDCILWNPDWTHAPNLTSEVRQQLERLLDKTSAKRGFGLDLYIEKPAESELIHRQAYWRGFFGYCHDQVTAKGLAEVGI